MSALSNYKITLGSSAHYRYFLVLLHGVAALLLLHSGLAWWVIIPLLFLLLLTLGVAIKQPYPAGGCRELVYQGGTWQLISNQAIDHFDNHRILLHAGLFILVRFSRLPQHKILVIFGDQLGPMDYRYLKMIEKIR